MAFTDAEKVAVRRYCGYEAYGAGPSGFQGWRFFQAYGLLEFRLNHLSNDEEFVVRDTYLTNLKTLEMAILGVSANLDTDKAAVWTHNKNEHADRERLYASWRRKLCDFLGLPIGKGLRVCNDLIV